MKIRKLSATFGALDRQTLALEEGLNIIEAPNEWGKSTWMGFIRAMLYGIDTRERDRKGVIAEKNRYQPWNGSPMEGSMELRHEGKEITLRRSGKSGAPLGRLQAVYTGTEEPIPGLTADNAGERLTGVGREVFERSAFIGQGSMAVTGSAELERRISAIVSSGQEDVSYSEAEQRLRDWKNRRRSNQKNGLIPRLEAEKAQTEALLSRLEAANQQAADARVRIRELEEEQSALEQQAQAHRALAGARARARYEQAKAEAEAAQTAWDTVHQERLRRGTPPGEATLREMQGELSYLNTLDANIKLARRETEGTEVPSMDIPHPVFAGMTPAEARKRAKGDSAILSKHSRPAPWTRVLAALLILAGVGMLLLTVFQDMIPPTARGSLLILCGVIICLFGVLQLLNIRKRKKETLRILSTYGVQSGDTILSQAEAYAHKWEAAEQARTEAAVRAVTLERLEAEREELAERLMETAHTFAPEVTDLYGVSAAVSLALSLGEKENSAALRLESAQKVLQAITAQGIPEEAQAPAQPPQDSEQAVAARLDAVRLALAQQHEALAMAQGEMNTLGDPAFLQAKLGQLEGELSLRQEEYDAVLIAMDTLNEANAALQARMSPALNARAGELLARLTGGRYDRVSLTREFEALAGQQDDVTPRQLLTLSKGTADQLYLAVRLAVCELVLAGEDPAPLVLDDALVNFDDRRLGLALELLLQLAGHRQILLFTCQSRERRYLGDIPGVHVISLQ